MEQQKNDIHKNRIDNFPMIPEEAFRYFPAQKDQRQIGQDGKILRWIFHDSLQFQKYENDQLRMFDSYLDQKKIRLNQFWDKSWTLRWLCSTGYNFQQTYNDMLKFDTFRKESDKMQLNKNIKRFLQSGAYYIAGRDAKYRPIIVFDIKKIVYLDASEQEIVESLTYFLNFVISQLMIPGQVQNWVSIIDNGKQGVTSFIGVMKTTLIFLSKTYRSRAFAVFMISCPTSVYYIWKIVKNFLDETTIRKVHFHQDQNPQKLFQFSNPQQIEQKFRGKAKNRQKYWPYTELSNHYISSDCPTNLVSSQQYRKRFESSQLIRTHVNRSLIQSPQIAPIIIPQVVVQEQKKRQQMKLLQQRIEKELQIRQQSPEKIDQDGLFCVSLCSQFSQIQKI